MIPEKKTTTVETYDDGKVATRTEIVRTTDLETVTAAKSDCPEASTVSAMWSRKEQDPTEWLSTASLEAFMYADHTSVYVAGTFSGEAIHSTCGIRIDDAEREIWWVITDVLDLIDVDSGDLDGKGTDLLDCMSHEMSWEVNLDEAGNLLLAGSDYVFRG